MSEPESLISLLPHAWRSDLAGCAVETVAAGMSGASVLHVRGEGMRDCYLKIARDGDAHALRREIARTRWLGAQGIRVPPVLLTFDENGIVAAMTSALAGVPANECDRRPAEIVEPLARALAVLHALPVETCPFDETVAVRLDRARDAIARGQVDPAHFDPRNRHVAPKDLHERLVATAPGDEDLVMVHGDATLDNMLIDERGQVGFVDCGHCGRADRYVDLAVAMMEIEGHFGEESAQLFVRAYGVTRWDEQKARYFDDLYEFF